MSAIFSKFSLYFAYLLIGFSIVATLYAGWLLWEMYRPPLFGELSGVAIATDPVVDQGRPVRLSFPDAGFVTPLQQGEVKNGTWSLSYDSAEFIDVPLASGSGTIVYGHNYLRILGKLGQVKVGQKVTVESNTGVAKSYEVVSKTLVSPTDLEKILPQQENELVVYTCAGFLDSKRLVVHAKFLN